MNWALVDSNGIVQNIIVYDGVSPYTPAEGLTIQQINSWVSMGENINIPQSDSEKI